MNEMTAASEVTLEQMIAWLEPRAYDAVMDDDASTPAVMYSAILQHLRSHRPEGRERVGELPQYELMEAAAIAWIDEMRDAYQLDLSNIQGKLEAAFKAGIRWMHGRRSAPAVQGRWIEWKPGDAPPPAGLYLCTFSDDRMDERSVEIIPCLELHGELEWWRHDRFRGKPMSAYWSIPLPPPYAPAQRREPAQPSQGECET
jgi:hypothetical protein